WTLLLYALFSHSSGRHRHLYSFPTRRSSDLERRNNILIIIGFTLLLLFLFIISFFIYNRQRLKLIKNQQDVEIANAITASEEARSEEHTSELQSRENLVCRLLPEKKRPDRRG